MKKQGKLIICSAPSGSGKTTLVHYLLQQKLNIYFSVSATSRAPRGEEQNGREYHFLTVKDFQDKIGQGAFVEWEEVYEGIFYGTLKSEVDHLLQSGKNVIFDVDVLGGLHLKEHYGEKALAIFIAPPSIEELQRRLQCRATDTEEVIAERIGKAAYELSFKKDFDIVIVNKNLEEARKNIIRKVKKFIYSEE